MIFKHSKTAVDKFVDGYAADHPYVKKIWAEIDALRDRDAVLRKKRDADTLAAHEHQSGC